MYSNLRLLICLIPYPIMNVPKKPNITDMLVNKADRENPPYAANQNLDSDNKIINKANGINPMP